MWFLWYVRFTEELKERALFSRLGRVRAVEVFEESVFVRRGFLGKSFALALFLGNFITNNVLRLFRVIRILLTLLILVFLFIGSLPLRLLRKLRIISRPIQVVGPIHGSRHYASAGFSLSSVLLGLVFGGLLLAALPVGGYFAAAYLVLGGEPDLENQKLLTELHQYRTAIAVRDTKGHLLGVMANYKKAPADYFDRDPRRDGKYRKGADRESALYVNKVPAFFWDVLVEREHKNLSFSDQPGFMGYIHGVINRSYRGIDVAAPLLKRLNRLRGQSGEGGGSTLLNIMVKNLYGADNFFRQKANLRKICPPMISWSATICRKFIEYRAARDLFPYLAQNNGEEFKRWVSTHVGLVGAVGNGAVYGIQGASAVMFGKKPEALNLAEQSLLAAAYKRDIRFAHPASDNLKLLEKRHERWQGRKKVAQVMAQRILARQGGSVLQAELTGQFDDLSTPKAPRIPDVLKPYFIGDVDDPDKQIKNYANLHTRLRIFMPSFKVLIENNLRSLMKGRPNGLPVELITTLPLDKDYEFRRDIDTAFEKLAVRYRFNKNLLFNDDDARKQLESASVRISVANAAGEVIRYYLREGGNAVEEKHSLRAKPYRPIASIAKIPLTTLLVSKGLKPGDKLCNRYYKGLSNAGGDKGVRGCSQSFTLEASMARSKNLPLRYAVGEKLDASQRELTDLFSDFALQIDGDDQSRNNMIENLSFGRAHATAAHTHQLMHKMADITYTGRGRVQPLHSIRQVRHVIYADNKHYAPAELSGVIKNDPFPALGKYFREPGAQSAMQQLLAAPVHSPGGTLGFTRTIRGGKVLLGKTGTLDTADGNIKDKYVIGLVSVKGQLYTFSILVGSEDYGVGGGLIANIKTRVLMKPLIQTIVDSLNAGSG